MDWLGWLELAGMYSVIVSVAMVGDPPIWDRALTLVFSVFSLIVITWMFVLPCGAIMQ